MWKHEQKELEKKQKKSATGKESRQGRKRKLEEEKQKATVTAKDEQSKQEKKSGKIVGHLILQALNASWLIL